MKTLYAFVLVSMFLLVGCTTLPSEPENGPPEPEPVPGPAPEPEPGEGRIMGYPPKNGDQCSSRAAHKSAVPEGYPDALCYDLKNLQAWCQLHRYWANTSGACMAIGAGHDH